MVPASAPKASPEKTAPVPSSSLVLVAHDSTLVVEMIQGVVKEAGLTVEHATDGLDALKKATTLKPKVMIVDVGLTGIYGFELCERLKGDPETKNIKIILLSSVYGLTAYKRNPITLYGADDYIEKHHIPDRLVPKLKQLLSGQPAAVPDLPPDSATAASEAPPATAGGPGPSTTPAAQPSPQAPDAKFAALEVPDVMPKVPVTLDTTWKRPVSQTSPAPAAAQPKVEVPRPLPVSAAPAVAEKTEPPRPEVRRPAMQDASVKLDATFFEQDEYVAPVKAPLKAEVDPEEVEKARRFARLIVSDIALYNQEVVAEGIAKGTFYDLLNDDITEGRMLYEKRVPDIIRESKDYYQEAFDNFIAAKKKQR
jgi:CheY-like chemotaxis protein